MIWFRLEKGGGAYECDFEPLGSTKCRNFVINWGLVSFSRTLLHGVSLCIASVLSDVCILKDTVF